MFWPQVCFQFQGACHVQPFLRIRPIRARRRYFLTCSCNHWRPRWRSPRRGGQIEGSVTNETGGVLPGVSVTLRNVATGINRETKTDGQGRYRAPCCPSVPTR